MKSFHKLHGGRKGMARSVYPFHLPLSVPPFDFSFFILNILGSIEKQPPKWEYSKNSPRALILSARGLFLRLIILFAFSS